MSPTETAAMSPARRQFSADPAERREPVLENPVRVTETRTPHAGQGFSNAEAERQYAQLHQRSSRFSAVGVMAGVLAGGAAAGVVLAWWLIQPIGSKPVVPRDLSTWKAPAAVSSTGTAVGAYPGVNPSELPYDGKPAAQTDTASGPAEPAASTVERPLAEESLAEAAKKVVEDDVPAAPAVTATPAPPARQATPVKPQAAKPVEKKIANAAPKPRPRPKPDREIERIRQQAAEELKKKSENRMSAANRAKRVATRSKTPAKAQTQQAERPQAKQEAEVKTADAARPQSRRAMFEQCEHASNLFARERCKWQVCGGLWGKQGCPSYERQASAY